MRPPYLSLQIPCRKWQEYWKTARPPEWQGVPQWKGALQPLVAQTWTHFCADSTDPFHLLSLPKKRKEISCLLCDDSTIRLLNQQWLGKDKATNVLSFPARISAHSPPPLSLAIGDLALAYETIAREAEAQNKAFSQHMTHLFVHGCLHLFGYDHEQTDEAHRMENIERKILSELGYRDPYA